MLVAEGKVLTEKDFEKLNRVKTSDSVGVSSGWGGYGFSEFVVTASSRLDTEVLLFETRKGYRIMALPEQKLFCKISRQKRCYYLALGEMEEGFLLFVMDFFLPQNTLASIMNTFDRVWFIRSLEDMNTARTEANVCSIKYGLPYVNFLRKRSFQLDFELVSKIFENVDTGQRSVHLFESEKIDHKHPHLLGIRNKDKKIMNLVLFGDTTMSPDRKSYKHKLYLENGNHFILKKAKRFDNLNLTELAATISDYKELQTFADTLSSLDEARIMCRYKLTDGECFYSMPAKNVFAGMDFPVYSGKEIVEDVIVKRKWMNFKGNGMEINVPEFYNVIYNGVVINLI